MFGFLERKQKPHPIDMPIKRVLDDMELYGPDTTEFPAYIEYLERLSKLRQEELKPKISLDTITVVAGNLLGILLIVAYEQKHVMTSKASSFSLKTAPPINN